MSEKLITKFKTDVIIITVDRLIKNIAFILFTEKADTEKLAYIFLK